MKNLTIVIPLGISTPGTPVLQYLKWCVESISNQKTNYSYDIIFSCDSNVSDNIKEYLNSTNYLIKWYDPFFYFKKGGIWKKIYDQWVETNSKYLAFAHYDDLWGENKIESQVNLLESTNSDICWSRVCTIDKANRILGEMKTLDKFTNETLNSVPTYAYAHSTIVSRKILETGILNYKEKWSAIYENLYYIYTHSLKGIKDTKSIFYHRVHEDSITNTFNDENSKVVIDQRQNTKYSLNDTLRDASEIDLDQIKLNIKRENYL